MLGLEDAPSTSPQVAAQPDENKYYIGSERWNRPDSDQSSHSDLEVVQVSQSLEILLVERFKYLLFVPYLVTIRLQVQRPTTLPLLL